MTTYADAAAVEFYEAEPESRSQYDLFAERQVLGAMMLAAPESDIIEQIKKLITPEDFYKPAHQEIAREVLALRDGGKPTDLAAVNRRFEKIRRLNAIGGTGYLSELLVGCTSSANGPFHAETVRDCATMRSVERAAEHVLQMMRNPRTDLSDVPELVDTAIKVFDVARSQIPGRELVYTGTLLDGALDRIEHPEQVAVIPSGYVDLDEGIYMGHRPGDLIIIGARPSTGKTIVGLDQARHAAVKLKIPTLFASIEMSTNAIMSRLISAEARVALTRIRNGTCTDDDWARIAARVPHIADAPLCIDHTPNMTLEQLDSAARDVQRERGLGLIVIDYLQKMTLPKADTEHAALGQLAERVKGIGEKYDVPVIALAQLNRGPEQRRDRRPLPSDLGGSNKLEAHADTIILLHREAQFDKESKRAGEIDLLLHKQRDGATGEVTLSFQGHYSRCQSMASDYQLGGILATNGARS